MFVARLVAFFGWLRPIQGPCHFFVLEEPFRTDRRGCCCCSARHPRPLCLRFRAVSARPLACFVGDRWGNVWSRWRGGWLKGVGGRAAPETIARPLPLPQAACRRPPCRRLPAARRLCRSTPRAICWDCLTGRRLVRVPACRSPTADRRPPTAVRRQPRPICPPAGQPTA